MKKSDITLCIKTELDKRFSTNYPIERQYLEITNKSQENLSWINVDLLFIYKDKSPTVLHLGPKEGRGETYFFQNLSAKTTQRKLIKPQRAGKIFKRFIVRECYLELENTKERITMTGNSSWGETTSGDFVKKQLCFVTTAAYGNREHPMVQAFIGLRDEMMVNFPSGRKTIAQYNVHGPKAAAVLDNYPFLKPIARCVLTPLAKTVLAARKVIDSSPRLRNFFYTPR